MTGSEKRYYSKKFMPKYLRNLNIAVPVVILGWVLLFFAAEIISAFALPELKLTGKIFIVFFIGLIVVIIVAISLIASFNKKLVLQRKTDLEEEFTEMSYEDAKAALTARGIINEKGVVITSMEGVGDVVPVLPFNEVKVYLFSANVCSKVLSVVSFCNQEGGVMAEYLIDRELYNYVEKSNFDAVFYGGSDMLFGDKGKFVKKVIKTRNSRGMNFAVMFGALGAIGAAISEHSKDATPEMEAVLRVLRRENI